jgi:hypothetical protein
MGITTQGELIMRNLRLVLLGSSNQGSNSSGGDRNYNILVAKCARKKPTTRPTHKWKYITQNAFERKVEDVD